MAITYTNDKDGIEYVRNKEANLARKAARRGLTIRNGRVFDRAGNESFDFYRRMKMINKDDAAKLNAKQQSTNMMAFGNTIGWGKSQGWNMATGQPSTSPAPAVQPTTPTTVTGSGTSTNSPLLSGVNGTVKPTSPGTPPPVSMAPKSPVIYQNYDKGTNMYEKKAQQRDNILENFGLNRMSYYTDQLGAAQGEAAYKAEAMKIARNLQTAGKVGSAIDKFTGFMPGVIKGLNPLNALANAVGVLNPQVTPGMTGAQAAAKLREKNVVDFAKRATQAAASPFNKFVDFNFGMNRYNANNIADLIANNPSGQVVPSFFGVPDVATKTTKVQTNKPLKPGKNVDVYDPALDPRNNPEYWRGSNAKYGNGELDPTATANAWNGGAYGYSGTRYGGWRRRGGGGGYSNARSFYNALINWDI